MDYNALTTLRQLILANARLIYDADTHSVDVLTAKSKEESGMYEAFLAHPRDRLVRPLVGTRPCVTREEAMRVLLEYTEVMVGKVYEGTGWRRTDEP